MLRINFITVISYWKTLWLAFMWNLEQKEGNMHEYLWNICWQLLKMCIIILLQVKLKNICDVLKFWDAFYSYSEIKIIFCLWSEIFSLFVFAYSDIWKCFVSWKCHLQLTCEVHYNVVFLCITSWGFYLWWYVRWVCFDTSWWNVCLAGMWNFSTLLPCVC